MFGYYKRMPMGEKTKNVTANVPDDLYAEINALAKESGVSVSKYVRTVIMQAVEKKMRVLQQTIIVQDKKHSKSTPPQNK